MLRQFIIPKFEVEGYFNLRPFDLVEDLHVSSEINNWNISKLVRYFYDNKKIIFQSPNFV